MERLNRHEEDVVWDYLSQSRLNVDGLTKELYDHVLSDIEYRVSEGISFNQAWEEVKREIPHPHIKSIDSETIKLLQKESRYTTYFIYLCLGLFIVSALFRLLHLPGSSILLLVASFLAIIYVLAGTSKNVYQHKQKEGSFGIVLIASCVVVGIIYWIFNLLQLPGSNVLRIMSTVLFITVFSGLSVHFYRSEIDEENHLVFINLKRNRSILNKIAMALLSFGCLFYYLSGGTENSRFMGELFCILSVIFTGLYAFTLSWQHIYKKHNGEYQKRRFWLLISTVTFLVFFMIPILGPLISPAISKASAIIALVTFISILFFYARALESSLLRYAVFFFLFGCILYAVLRVVIGLGVFLPLVSVSIPALYVSSLITLLLATGLILFRKQQPLQLLAIVMIGFHLIPLF